MDRSHRRLVSLAILLAVAGSGFGLWKYHSSRLDQAYLDGVLLGDVTSVTQLATALDQMSKGDNDKARIALEFALANSLESADRLAAEGAELGPVAIPSILEALRRAEAVTDANGKKAAQRLRIKLNSGSDS